MDILINILSTIASYGAELIGLKKNKTNQKRIKYYRTILFIAIGVLIIYAVLTFFSAHKMREESFTQKLNEAEYELKCENYETAVKLCSEAQDLAYNEGTQLAADYFKGYAFFYKGLSLQDTNAYHSALSEYREIIENYNKTDNYFRVSQTFWTPSEIWDNLPNIIEPSNTDGVITMARNKLVDMIGKLSEEQVERLSGIAMEYLDLNTKVEDTAPQSCPCCGAANAHFIKRGFSGRKQRYQCKSCGKRFTFDAGKLTAYSHQTEEAWATFIRDTLSLKSLDECAANISVSHPTSFYMRHKLLCFLEEALKGGELLEGIVEADEAYILESQKGIPVTTRKPRNHGEPATKRGLSDEQMCICVAADREGRVVAHCVNRAKPTADNIQEALGSRIGENGVFLCDGATAYNKLIEAKKCQKIVLNNHKDYNKAYHLNTVNGLHSRLKAMLHRYRGVSSKYLNRYLALFTALEQAGRSVFHPEIDSVRQMIAKVNAVRHIRKLSTEAVLAF